MPLSTIDRGRSSRLGGGGSNGPPIYQRSRTIHTPPQTPPYHGTLNGHGHIPFPSAKSGTLDLKGPSAPPTLNDGVGQVLFLFLNTSCLCSLLGSTEGIYLLKSFSVSSRYICCLFVSTFLSPCHVSCSIALYLSPFISVSFYLCLLLSLSPFIPVSFYPCLLLSLSRIQNFCSFILFVSLSGYLLLLCVSFLYSTVPVLAVFLFSLSPALGFSFSSGYLGFFLLSFILFSPSHSYIFKLS